MHMQDKEMENSLELDKKVYFQDEPNLIADKMQLPKVNRGLSLGTKIDIVS